MYYSTIIMHKVAWLDKKVSGEKNLICLPPSQFFLIQTMSCPSQFSTATSSTISFSFIYTQEMVWGSLRHTCSWGGGLGGLDPQNPKYPTQTLARLGASAKFWQKKRVFKGLFERFSDLPQAFFGKVPHPDFWSYPRMV